MLVVYVQKQKAGKKWSWPWWQGHRDQRQWDSGQKRLDVYTPRLPPYLRQFSQIVYSF
jgi:hypothetical protein